MFSYFLWNIPKFYSVSKCQKLFRQIFTAFSFTMIHSHGEQHSGYAQLITPYPLDFVHSNKVPFSIGTRYPVFIKPDERHVPGNFKDHIHSRPMEHSFEFHMDTLDGVLPSSTVFITQKNKKDAKQTDIFLTKHTIPSLKMSDTLNSIDINGADNGGLYCTSISGLHIQPDSPKLIHSCDLTTSIIPQKINREFILRMEHGDSFNIKQSMLIQNQTIQSESVNIDPHPKLPWIVYSSNENIGRCLNDGLN